MALFTDWYLCDYYLAMNMQPIALLGAGLYLLATLFTGLRFFSENWRLRLPRGAITVVLVGGLLAHALLLWHFTFNQPGLNISLTSAASLVSFTVVVIITLTAVKQPVENLGLLLFPLATLAMLAAVFRPGEHLLAARSPWGLRLHVVISIVAYALFTLAAVQALLLAIQNAKLKAHHPGGFMRALPPLQTMEGLLFSLILTGFVLLTVSLFSGFMFLDDMFAQHLVHKTVLSLISWVVFAILLWGRFVFGWRGRIAIRWTLVGFTILMLAYFGSKAVLELLIKPA